MDSDGYLSQLADIFNGITVNTPSISAIIAIALAGVLLLASGFASASEIAFFSLSPSDKNDIDERKHPADEKISFLLDDSERLLATILITNNFVNVTIIMLCNFFFMNVFVFHSPLAEFLIFLLSYCCCSVKSCRRFIRRRRRWLSAVSPHRGFMPWKRYSIRLLLSWCALLLS